MRLSALRSRPCAQRENRALCPEIFLDVVADKLTGTAVLFLNVELLSEFYYHFPRELDARLGRGLRGEVVERLAREDPKVARHLDVVRRKERLEQVLGRVEDMRELEGRARAGHAEAPPREKERKAWGLF